MLNPFAYIQKKRAQKEQLARLSTISTTFGNIEKLIKSNLLHWDRRHRRLFIAEPLAMFFIARGAEQWSNFLNNVYQYVAYLHLNDKWNSVFVQRSNKAIAEAKRKTPTLTKDDILRIRRATRSELAETDVKTPEISAFDFFVVKDSKDAKAQTTLVGTFDPASQLFNIVPWDDIQQHFVTPEEE